MDWDYAIKQMGLIQSMIHLTRINVARTENDLASSGKYRRNTTKTRCSGILIDLH